MTCSHFTIVLALLIVWAAAAVNSNAMEGLSSGHEGHVGIPEMFYWPHSQEKRTSTQVCGQRLIGALRALCHGRYAVARRSDPSFRPGGAMEESDYHELSTNDLSILPDSAIYHEGDNYSPNDIDLLWPYNPKLMAFKILSEGPSHQRVRRNVIEECCKKPCTQSEMRKYCGT